MINIDCLTACTVRKSKVWKGGSKNLTNNFQSFPVFSMLYLITSSLEYIYIYISEHASFKIRKSRYFGNDGEIS